jgi:hypothetical protein
MRINDIQLPTNEQAGNYRQAELAFSTVCVFNSLHLRNFDGTILKHPVV